MGKIIRAARPADLSAITQNLQTLSSEMQQIRQEAEAPTMRGRALDGFAWYKAFRINKVPNEFNSLAENVTVVFQMISQSDFGNTANRQVSEIFGSFGVRGGPIRPVLVSKGSAPLGAASNQIDFRVYKAADGYAYLWIKTATFSLSQISYQQMGLDGYQPPFEKYIGATYNDTNGGFDVVDPVGYGAGELIWSFESSAGFQDMYIGNKRVLTE